MASLENVENIDDLVELAKMAEQAERYEDMVDRMIKVTKKGEGLNNEQRNLLSVAYKNVVGGFRSSWRVLSSLKDKETNGTKEKLLVEYKKKVEKELNGKCDEVLELLNNHLIGTGSPEAAASAKVFYLKMKGDYNRYKVEVADENSAERQLLVDESDNAYKQASEACKEIESKMDPICLGLALNYSVFFYEIANKPGDACALAKKAFDDALEELQRNQDNPNSKDSTLIMQLLQDNLTLWSNEEDE